MKPPPTRPGAARGWALLLAVLFALGCCGGQSKAPEQPVVVSVAYPGASAADVEALVVVPLENTLNSTPGLRRMESTAVEGEGWVVLRFDDTSTLDAKLLEVRELLVNIGGNLPADAEAPRIGFGAGWDRIPLEFAVTGPDGEVPDAALVDGLVVEIERLPGIDHCAVAGAREPRIEITADPARAAMYGVGLALVATSLGAGLSLGGDVSLDDLGAMALTADGPVLLQDVAEVRQSWFEGRATVQLDGRPVALISPVMRPGEDAETMLAALREVATGVDWPEGVEAFEVDRTDFDVEIDLQGLGDDHSTLAAIESLRMAAGKLDAQRELLTLGVQRDGAQIGAARPGQVSIAWHWEADPPGRARASFNDTALTSPWIDLRRLELDTDRSITVVVSGADRGSLYDVVDDMVDRLAVLDEVHGVWDDRAPARPGVDVELDAERAARYGVSALDVAQGVAAATHGVEIGTVADGAQRIPVILRWRATDGPEALRNVPISAAGEGGPATVPLSAVATLSITAEDTALHRVDGQTAITLTVVVEGSEERSARKAIEATLPTDIPEGTTVWLEPRSPGKRPGRTG